MSNPKFQNLLLKAIAASGICLASTLAFPEKIQSAACEDNPGTFSSNCEGTPERYEITIYEMGLCTGDPLTGTNFDGSTCTSTLTSTGGVTVDIGGSTTASLAGGTATRPPNNTYKYAYIKMKKYFWVAWKLHSK